MEAQKDILQQIDAIYDFAVRKNERPAKRIMVLLFSALQSATVEKLSLGALTAMRNIIIEVRKTWPCKGEDVANFAIGLSQSCLETFLSLSNESLRRCNEYEKAFRSVGFSNFVH